MEYRLQDLIDISQFQALQDKLNEIYCFPSAIIDNDGHILTATTWQDLCTKFHRQNKDCEAECLKSDNYILNHLAEANPAVSYQCPHGLLDNATPIIIDGVHLGNFFTGQFFLKEPDLEFFRSQARKYGFDEAEYLEAVKKVPIWTHEKLDSYLFFIKELIDIISSVGLKNLRAIEAKQKTEESEQLYKTLIQNSFDVIFTLDSDGTFLFVSPAWELHFGYPVSEVEGRNFALFVHPDDAGACLEYLKKVLRTGQSGTSPEFRVRHADVSWRWFIVNGSLCSNSNGQSQFMGTGHDITKRKLAEESLQKSEESLKEAQRLAAIGSWWWTAETDALKWSEELYRICGRDPSLPAPSLAEMKSYYTPESWQRLSTTVAEGLRSGAPYELELEMVRPDGTIRHVASRGETDRDGSGKIEGQKGIVQDITERKRTEAAKNKLEAQLQQAQKMESVGRLAGGVAHDFNNMLGVILGHADMALEEMDPARPLYEDLNAIREAARRSANLTRQLLAFARKQIIEPQVLDLNQTIDGMLKMLRRIIGEDIRLIWRPETNIWPVRIDPSQVDQILANLCVNARDAISGVGTVTIETETRILDESYCAAHLGFVPGEYVCLSVSDDGCGMDEKTLSSIFEPFFTTKSIGKGTGLGLSTVYGIVKQNNGFINAYSEPSHGTTFTIYLPRHLSQEGRAEQWEIEEKPAKRGYETILLVEDEPAILKLAKVMLERLGYKVLAASAPGEAIRIASEHKGEINLLMTDVIMPQMNGRELAQKLLSIHAHIKVLFVSGYTADVIARHGVLDEGTHFLQKPFSVKDLAARLREVLDGDQQGFSGE